MKKKIISLAQGAGGKEMAELISSFRFSNLGKWKCNDDDSAIIKIGDEKFLAFSTDSFVVDPIFFEGGDIGKLAVCGTINDLVVMGADPLGLSLALVIEEGFAREKLKRIIESIDRVSKEIGVPVVTGDTKVMERGKVDKIIINVSGTGIAKKENLLTRKVLPGDKIIISGGIGEHAAAILSKRFDYKSNVKSDSKPLIDEMKSIRQLIKVARDPTRGGIASVLNDLCRQSSLSIEIEEDAIPAREEVRNISGMLGISIYELACEGRVVCVCSPENATEVEKKLKKFNKDARIIGEMIGPKNNKNCKVILNTFIGKSQINVPSGNIVPRIC